MNSTIDTISTYLQTPVLRVLTCGSVDDGKSTFLGRLLFDTGNVYEDHLVALDKISKKYNPAGDEPELAFLIDGLKSELEQGITIDVAYRYFFTRNRKFILADAPGHAQYTRNMAVAASKSDVAIVMVDATSGISSQTKRHLSILSMLRVSRLIIAVNKMDLVNFGEQQYEKTRLEITEAIRTIYDRDPFLWLVPVSSKLGDNVARNSRNMPWYRGKSVLELLESIGLDEAESTYFCMPVQYVMRDSDKRYYAGTVISCRISIGEEIVVLPSKVKTKVRTIMVAGQNVETAGKDDPVMLELADDVDVSRGDKMVRSENRFSCGDRLSCQFFWFGEKPMIARDVYELKFLSRKTRATIEKIEAHLDLETLQRIPATRLARNEIGFGSVTLSSLHYCLPFRESKELGSFLIVDIGTGDTVGIGTIGSIEKISQPYPYDTAIDKTMRALLKNQHPMLVWLTGLSGAGKSTVANLLEQRLYDQGFHTYLLDGDNLRDGLNSDLGFDPVSRRENIRRAGEVARLMVDAGIIVVASFISPFLEDRAFVRGLFGKGEFCEVYVKAPLEVCIRRDPKGLYAKALNGEIPDFTGVNSPYEPPDTPEITIDTSKLNPQEAVRVVLTHLAED